MARRWQSEIAVSFFKIPSSRGRRAAQIRLLGGEVYDTCGEPLGMAAGVGETPLAAWRPTLLMGSWIGC